MHNAVFIGSLGGTSTSGGLFGSTQTQGTSLFGGGSANKTLFGGATTTTTASSGFGTGFGTQSGAGTSLFGNQQNKVSSTLSEKVYLKINIYKYPFCMFIVGKLIDGKRTG